MLKFIKNLLKSDVFNKEHKSVNTSSKEMIMAQELDKHLKNDPDFLLRKSQKDEELIRAKLARDKAMQPLMDELHKYGIKSFKNFLKEYYPLKQQVVEVLLQWLLKIEGPPYVKEMILFALAHPKLPYDGRLLAELYDRENNNVMLRFRITATIAAARPLYIEEWVASTALKNELSIDELGQLPLAVARLLPIERSIPILYQIYEQAPADVAQGMGEIGKEKELEFLKQKVKIYKGYGKKIIMQSIKKIEKRLG